jgi:hypothetical protein
MRRDRRIIFPPAAVLSDWLELPFDAESKRGSKVGIRPD